MMNISNSIGLPKELLCFPIPFKWITHIRHLELQVLDLHGERLAPHDLGGDSAIVMEI